MLERSHPAMSQTVNAVIERGRAERAARLRWPKPDAQQLDANANDLKASEEGAEGVAFVTVWRTDRYLVRMRAFHGSGADWLLQKQGQKGDDVVRLEVSGIVGKASATSRLREKVEELRAGKLRRPGIALVVAFPPSPVRILMEDVL